MNTDIDPALDASLRIADPYPAPTVATLDLAGADRALLEEILTNDLAARPASSEPAPRAMWRRAPAFAVAAAAVAAIAVVSTHGAGPHGSGAPAASTPPNAPVHITYAAAILTAAEHNPRLLIGQPGWTLDTVYGFTGDTGTIRFVKTVGTEQANVEMNWYPAARYAEYVDDRNTDAGHPVPTTVAGSPAALYRFSATDFAALRAPDGTAFAEIRVQGLTRTEAGALLATIRHVDVQTFLDAMPPSVVTPARAQAALDDVLAGIPLPPGFDRGSLLGLGTNDGYQFRAKVTGAIGCAWIAQYQHSSGSARLTAAAALVGSHQWKALTDIAGEGGWSQVFWAEADAAASGHVHHDYREALGC